MQTSTGSSVFSSSSRASTNRERRKRKLEEAFGQDDDEMIDDGDADQDYKISTNNGSGKKRRVGMVSPREKVDFANNIFSQIRKEEVEFANYIPISSTLMSPQDVQRLEEVTEEDMKL